MSWQSGFPVPTDWIFKNDCINGKVNLPFVCKSWCLDFEHEQFHSVCLLFKAVKKGHLNCLKCAHENGCPWDRWVCIHAAYNGHL